MIEINQTLNNTKSLANIADGFVLATKKLLQTVKTEEDLKIGFEKLLEPIKKEVGISVLPKFEKTIFQSGRSDALHGQVIIEYEPPASFRSKSKVEHAFEQLVDYIIGESQNQKETLFLFGPKFVGVGFDGEKIFFTRYKTDKLKAKAKLSPNDFTIDGPYDFDPESARTFLTYLRSLSRLPLTAENLAQQFGPKSILAPQIVSALADSLEHWGNPTNERLRVFFNEWKRLFGIVYGEQFSGHQAKEAQDLAALYGVGEETDFQELLFCVHTYFALLMKLLAAEILTLKDSVFNSSLALELTHLSSNDFQAQLMFLEDGGLYAQKGITNFLEGDFFRWYIDGWTPRLEEALKEMCRALSEFEPATTSLAPLATKDLLKKLYQYLVPQSVRHRLGEYYTPDWLAELLLKETGYDGNNLKRFLDPACGSGTFLVLAIQKAKDWGKKNNRPALEIAKSIKANIWGFDLNPLAVIAARTNYLFALGDLASKLEFLEIPIYLTDSVLTPNKTSGDLFGDYLEVQTSVGPFQVPAEWVELGGFFLGKAAPLIEEMIKNRYSVAEAMARFQKQGVPIVNKQIAENFYKRLLELEKQNKNGIWARFLKNAFAPMIAGKFDFVCGNPPWIMWQDLSNEYREATRKLWDLYELTKIRKTSNVLIKGRRDFSMLFVYALADYYLKDNGKLGFLITQEVFKSKGAGEGFRRFQLGEKKYLQVLKALDLVSVQPFEGAANKTAGIILSKGKKTEYPVPYVIYTKKKGVGRISQDKTFDEAMMFLQKKVHQAKPIGSEVGSWRTFEIHGENFSKLEGENFYKSYRGISVPAYGVFCLEVLQRFSDGDLLIKNLAEEGKRNLQSLEARTEASLVYPILRGIDIKRWQFSPKMYTLLTHIASQKPYPEPEMRNRWPKTYIFFE